MASLQTACQALRSQNGAHACFFHPLHPRSQRKVFVCCRAPPLPSGSGQGRGRPREGRTPQVSPRSAQVCLRIARVKPPALPAGCLPCPSPSPRAKGRGPQPRNSRSRSREGRDLSTMTTDWSRQQQQRRRRPSRPLSAWAAMQSRVACALRRSRRSRGMTTGTPAPRTGRWRQRRHNKTSLGRGSPVLPPAKAGSPCRALETTAWRRWSPMCRTPSVARAPGVGPCCWSPRVSAQLMSLPTWRRPFTPGRVSDAERPCRELGAASLNTYASLFLQRQVAGRAPSHRATMGSPSTAADTRPGCWGWTWEAPLRQRSTRHAPTVRSQLSRGGARLPGSFFSFPGCWACIV